MSYVNMLSSINAMIIMVHDIKYGSMPEYLKIELTQTFENNIEFNLRNNTNHRLPTYKKQKNTKSHIS